MSKKPKKTNFLITNAFTRGMALAAVAALKGDKAMQVIIRPFKESEGITDAQRRLYWMLLTDLQNTDVNDLAGRTKDQWHIFMKRRFLLPIYCRESADFAGMVETVKRCGDEERKSMMRWIIKETSITKKCEDDPITGEKSDGKMIRIMREYIDCVMNYARGHGVLLRIDARIFAEAMGHEYQKPGGISKPLNQF